jgi:HlyD family secretion protein
MSSNRMRIGFAAVLATIGTTALVLAQAEPIKSVTPKGIPVFNPVEGRVVVLTSKAEGALVQKGEVVCEFDPDELRDRLTNQEFVVRAAVAELHSKRIAREVAVMAETEYKNSAFPQHLAATQSEIALAESKLSRAEDQVDWLRRMFQKGFVSMQEKTGGELVLRQTRFALEQAQLTKNVLTDHSKQKTIKTLLGEVESARARELGAQASLERERSLQKKLTDQLNRCKVVAPVAGHVEYAALIDTGAVVRDGDLLFRILPKFAPKTKAE